MSHFDVSDRIIHTSASAFLAYQYIIRSLLSRFRKCNNLACLWLMMNFTYELAGTVKDTNGVSSFGYEYWLTTYLPRAVKCHCLPLKCGEKAVCSSVRPIAVLRLRFAPLIHHHAELTLVMCI